MADPILLKLKKDAEKKKALTGKVTIKLTDDELRILSEKASLIAMSKEDLLREYVLQSSAFDTSDLDKKLKKQNESEAE